MNLPNLVKAVDPRRAKAALAWMPRALQPHSEPRAVPPTRPAPFLRALSFILLALALGGVLLWSSPAQAQNPSRILVSNSGHPAETHNPLALDVDFPRHAQRFTTGSDAAGYTLETLFIGFYHIADRSTPGSELTVTLNEESNGNPGTALCTLINPSAFGGFGMHSFSAPNTGMDQCPALRANTTYFAVIERANPSTSAIELSITRTYGGDSNSLEGWSIGNGAHRYVSANTPPWTHSPDSPNLFFRVHGVGIPHPPRVTGFDLHSDNDNPKGIWGNDETIWVSQSGTTARLFAYKRSDGSRDSSKDFNTLSAAGNGAPTGLCSDGTTMFVVDGDDNKVYAYTLSTGARDAAKDITLHADNDMAEGLWCDDDYVWVVDDDTAPNNDILAYNRADGTPNTDVDFPDLDPTVDGSPLNANPRGIYSNGETMFVVDDEDATVYAWNVLDQTRGMDEEDKEIALDGDNADPEGLWFDGRVLWVVDDDDDRVYAYDLPGAQPDNARADGVPGVRTSSSKDAWAATLTVGRHITGNGYISGTSPVTGSLSSQATFTLDGVTYTVVSLYTGAGALVIGLDKYPTREFTLSVAGESFVSAGRRVDLFASSEEYIWRDAGLSWPHNDTISVSLSFDYVPKKGGELTADVSGIRDSTDGVANAFFHYQWLRVDGTDETGLDGETGPAYTPTGDDVGKHLKVRVVFDDDADNKEYPRTSLQVGPVGTNGPATGAPAITGAPRAGGMLTVDLSGINDPEGTDDAEFTYQWISIDGDSEADIPNATRPTYRPIEGDAGKTIKVKVSFTDNEGFQEGPLTSEPTDPIVDADVLVRNTGQISDGTTHTLTNSHSTRAQAFTTSPNTNGYNLDSIGFLFDDIDNISTAGIQLTVTLRADSSGNPGSALCTLTNPATFSASGVHTFSAPTTGTTCATLAASTTYFAVIERGTVTSDTISLKTTNNSNEDPGSATGWAIGNDRHFLGSSSWDTTASQSHQIEVKGASATAPIVSDNRTWIDNRRGHAATGYDNTGAFTIAQGFRTGNTAGIFEVHEISVDFDRGQPAGDIQVRIVESTAPDDFWEYATPSGFWKGGNYKPQTVTTDGTHTFRRTSGNGALKANTNYFLVIESTNDDSADAAIIRMTEYEGEDSEDGWTVDDYSHSKAKQPNATWTKQGHQVRFRIAGSYWEGLGMAGDSYAYESCVELRRGERTNCIAAIAVPEPADPENPPENVRRSGLVIDPDLFPEIAEWWTGWWQWMHEYIAFPVTMNPLPTGSDYVTMSFGTRDYTAKSGQDYWGGNGSVRFDANSNHTQIVNIRIIDDRVEDSGDYFEFFLFQCRDQNGDNCDHLFGVDSSVRGIIYNTEESAEISYLTVSDVTVTEDEGATAEFTVSLTAPTTAAVYFDYATEDGTAKDGADYTGGSGTAFLANGDTSVTISVPIANDETWTGDRSFTLKISDAVYAAISDDTGVATIKDDEPQPLISQFANVPEGNHGETSFKFNISFNQDVGTKYLVMQNDVMTVTNGEITRAERINKQRDFWRITVQPDSGEDVTVHLPATESCSDTGAVCTRGDNPQPLSNSITHTFAGTELNAEFERFEYYHDGKTPMQLRLVFSEEVDTNATEIKDHALTVTGAAITTVVQKDEGSTRKWTVMVTPAGTGPIDVVLASATDCALEGHICTPDGELLTRGDWKRSSGPPVISVADAAVTEGDGAQLAFNVTLDRSWSGPVPTVSYATSDGTASAGSDYTAGSGALTLTWTRTGSLIRPWTLAGTIMVPVTNDTAVEETETLTLTLSSPVWATLGDDAATGTIEEDDVAVVREPDSAPTGLPVITGTPEADSALTADTSAIDDANGLTGVSYSYQWIVTTSGADADIEGATASTYTPRTAHVGRTFKVRVSFTDDDDYQHTLTSDPTTPITKPADGTVWSADMLVVEYTDISIGAATADLFSNIGGSGNLQIKSLWSYVPDNDLRLAFTDAFDDAEDHTLIVGDLTLEFPAGSSGEQSFKWTDVDLDWEDGQTIAVSIVPTTPVEPTPNTPATGLPTINGTPQVGMTLTADVSGITDANGLTGVSYSYQWIANNGTADTDLQDATASAYTPSVSDLGKTIKVKVSFTDDANNDESLTSVATTAVAATVPAAPLSLTVATGDQIQELDASWQAPSSNGGSAVTGYKVQWKEAADSWDTAADVSEAAETGTTHTITGLTGGVEYAVRVIATNDVGDGPASTEAKGTPAGGVSEQTTETGNSAPTGLPGISGTPQVDQTLTADTSPIDDEDGLINVSYRYQWIAGGADIDGATGSSYELTYSEQGKIIQVRVAFTDDADNQETLTSEATVAVAAAANREATGQPTISGTPQVEETLTADTSPIDDADGLTNVSYSYQWIAGGTNIDGATGSSYELTSSEQGKTIQVRVTFTDDRGNAESLTSVATGAVAAAAAQANNPPTGLPGISGTPQVDQTLTADTTNIVDQDGLTGVSYIYQWIAGGSDIGGATGSTHTLTASEQGKTIQVRVTFTDDRNNAETLTSAATLAVAAKPVPLTATFSNVPTSHSGSGEFTFDLAFSENLELSYITLRDHAFTEDDHGPVTRAQRKVQGSNQTWTITVEPSGNGAITITLPATTDCTAAGAICTSDGRKLSNSTTVTIPGPQ